MDRQWRVTYINQRALNLFNIPRDALLGKVLWEALPAASGTQLEQEYRRAMQTRQPVTFEVLSPMVRRRVDINVYPMPQRRREDSGATKLSGTDTETQEHRDSACRLGNLLQTGAEAGAEAGMVLQVAGLTVGFAGIVSGNEVAAGVGDALMATGGAATLMATS